MKITRALCALFLIALACVSMASAGGMVKFHVSPVADPKVGDTVTVTIYNDNNLAPKEGDVVLMLDWNAEVMRYVSSTVDQGHTTASDPIGTHNLEIRSADTVNGLPNGDGALATVTFKIVGPGFTPIVVDVKSVTDVTGADITSKAVASNGAVTATGTAATTGATTVPTTVATTGSVTVTTVPVNTTAATLITTVPTTGITTGITTAFTTIQTAIPVSGGSDGSVNGDTDEYTGVVTKTATPTPTKTVTPTATSTPNVTATQTPTPTATPTASATTIVATKTANATASSAPVTPTTTKAALPLGALALVALAGVALVLQRTRR